MPMAALLVTPLPTAAVTRRSRAPPSPPPLTGAIPFAYQNLSSQETLLALIDNSQTHTDLVQVHAAVLRRGLHHDRIVNFKLQKAYSSLGCLDDSVSIFNCTLDPNVFNWTAIIHSHAQSGLHDRAMSHFVDMLCSGIEPNAFTFSAALKSCPIKPAKSLHCLAFKLGFGSDLYVETGLVDVYAKGGDVSSAQKLFDEMSQRSLVSLTSMITCYAKLGEMGKARKVFDEMPERDVVCWNVMISGYAHNGFPNEALLMFRTMMSDRRLRPNEMTVLAVLSACSQIGALETGRWLHSFIESSRIPVNLHLGTALIDMYSKCGSLDDARLVFVEMAHRDVVAWNSMISAYAMHGLVDEALGTFDEMRRLGMNPNDVTFIGVLNACSHTGMVQEGRALFEMMRNKYGIEPKVEHYGCLVNLLGRAGLVDEAYDLVKGMREIEPDIVIYGSLLGSCRLYNHSELGEEIAAILLEKFPVSSGTYALLSNIHASSGNWIGVGKVRGLMRANGIVKEKGCSSIEVDNTVHEFLAGDMTHLKSREIYEMLEKMNGWVRAEGYEPRLDMVLQDIGDEEKGRSLEVHSERLAIAFGLISTEPGSTIRVVKNLRVCSDCHEVSKVISRVTGRRIVMRDRNRFHHFVDGECSCGDFW